MDSRQQNVSPKRRRSNGKNYPSYVRLPRQFSHTTMDEGTNPFQDVVLNIQSEVDTRARRLNGPSIPVSSSYPKSPSRPLIRLVKNGWITANSNHIESNSIVASPSHNCPADIRLAFKVIAASRLRRYLIVYMFLL